MIPLGLLTNLLEKIERLEKDVKVLKSELDEMKIELRKFNEVPSPEDRERITILEDSIEETEYVFNPEKEDASH